MYDDIIDLPHHESNKYPRMSIYDRCSQFMPFSALTGYSDAIKETARLTTDKVVLDDELKEILNNKLNKIKEMLSCKPIVDITYFIPDLSKDGGFYKNVSGVVRKIDLYKNIVVMGDGVNIPISDIIDIVSDIFDIVMDD